MIAKYNDIDDVWSVLSFNLSQSAGLPIMPYNDGIIYFIAGGGDAVNVNVFDAVQNIVYTLPPCPPAYSFMLGFLNGRIYILGGQKISGGQVLHRVLVSSVIPTRAPTGSPTKFPTQSPTISTNSPSSLLHS